ncbi:hypothetical protein BJY16_007625 [Actinoplanes octamycinicus]|uniref:Uncharacterized protein n=1 Tax=Actinoplanes octamycinicus TaxID=135948 RepID=A0A7W7MBL7_9ACTN|nr:hypothetical protein [Actinoplanes octamycinicus]MBB4744166.1 hypothetical protein [Actinoplanes octamycinicus]GIE56878.1 hypothetical protein Aoc01nite_22800 [Actinoplanes octamycinicus]
MSGNRAAVAMISALLLAGCADQSARPDQPATGGTSPAAGCGLATAPPAGTTLRGADVGPDDNVTVSRFVVLPAERCDGVAVQPDRCDTFPWTGENDLYALGGRAWLSVTLGGVREQVVLYAPDSSFAATYQQAADSCGFTTLTVLNGRPVTLQRARDGISEIVYLTARSVIWLSSVDPAIGAPELIRLASLAEDRSRTLTYPS